MKLKTVDKATGTRSGLPTLGMSSLSKPTKKDLGRKFVMWANRLGEGESKGFISFSW